MKLAAKNFQDFSFILKNIRDFEVHPEHCIQGDRITSWK